MAQNISKEFWVKEDREKPKYRAKDVIAEIRKNGFPDFGPTQHTSLWKEYDAKNTSKGFGVSIANYWYWYDTWIKFILDKLQP